MFVPQSVYPSFILMIQNLTEREPICNSPSSPLADIVLFEFSLKVFKMPLLGRGFHTLIKNTWFSFPTMWDLIIHPLRGPVSCWHSFPSPINVGPPNPPPSRLSLLASTSPVSGYDTNCNGPSPSLANIVVFGLSLPSLTSRFLKRVC